MTILIFTALAFTAKHHVKDFSLICNAIKWVKLGTSFKVLCCHHLDDSTKRGNQIHTEISNCI